ncbi:MAG: 50S ribosomal protein L10 [Acidobacteria bacterium]|nr:MAG: 50S ribosomal protein L10 [Acidobacteriota bacterium]RLE23577.1 MAG: 50S ribosomal protein L10 [Acidobacteriota bacterium]
MLKKDKIALVDGLRDELKDVKCFYMFQFSKVSVIEDNELRMKIRETGSTYRVVKNRLLAKATEGTALEPLTSGLKQTTVVAYSNEDPVGLAKLLTEFGKGREEYFFKGGILENQVLTENEFVEVAKLPSKEELIAKMLYLLQYPIQGLVTALEGVYRQLPVVLKQIADKEN